MTEKLRALGRVLLLSILIINTSCDKDEEVILSDANLITLFTVTSGDFTENFEVKEDKVEGVLPYRVDAMDLSLTINISDKATITPSPSTITAITAPITFVVTAENGEKKNYIVDIQRELSPENTMVSFGVKTPLFETNAAINNEMGTISQRMLPGTVLTSIETLVAISDRATIAPDPTTIMDYSSPVNFTVTAENGDIKEYVVNLGLMNEDYEAKCDIANASKWFGGDDREGDSNPGVAPRNVGTGNVIFLDKDTYPTNFGFHVTDAFRGNGTSTERGDLELEFKLNIRDQSGDIIKTTNTKLTGVFKGGWIDFDLSSLNLFLKKDTQYNFTYYLIDGEALGVSTGSDANLNVDTGICGATGFSGESRIRENTFLENWNVWWPHEWHFNFRLEGKQ